jgi:hypothetical protein
MKIGSEPGSTTPAAEISPSELAKLHKSGLDFEAILLNSLWKAGQTDTDGDEEDDFGGMKGPFQELGFQALTNQAAKAGGLGIGRMIERSVLAKMSHGHGLSGLTNMALPADIQDAYSSGHGRMLSAGSDAKKN